MANRIRIDLTARTDQWTAKVSIADQRSESHHTVTIPQNDYQQLTGGEYSPEQLVETSFEFLLQHESKESILSSFQLMVIARYFPEYPDTIRRMLAEKYGE